MAAARWLRWRQRGGGVATAVAAQRRQQHGSRVVAAAIARRQNQSIPHVKPIILGRLDAWDKGRYVALVKDVKEANLDIGGRGGGTSAQWDELP